MDISKLVNKLLLVFKPAALSCKPKIDLISVRPWVRLDKCDHFLDHRLVMTFVPFWPFLGTIKFRGVPGHRDEQSSYRGELGGILSGLAYANKIFQQSGTTSGEHVFGCDKKGALDTSFGWKTPNPNWTCFDLLVSEIWHQLRLSPVTWKKKHIRGHQEDNTTFEQLSNTFRPRHSQRYCGFKKKRRTEPRQNSRRWNHPKRRYVAFHLCWTGNNGRYGK